MQNFNYLVFFIVWRNWNFQICGFFLRSYWGNFLFRLQACYGVNVFEAWAMVRSNITENCLRYALLFRSRFLWLVILCIFLNLLFLFDCKIAWTFLWKVRQSGWWRLQLISSTWTPSSRSFLRHGDLWLECRCYHFLRHVWVSGRGDDSWLGSLFTCQCDMGYRNRLSGYFHFCMTSSQLTICLS